MLSCNSLCTSQGQSKPTKGPSYSSRLVAPNNQAFYIHHGKGEYCGEQSGITTQTAQLLTQTTHTLASSSGTV